MLLFLLYLLHQLFFIHGEISYTIQRFNLSPDKTDTLHLPSSKCLREEDVCTSFSAKVDESAEDTHSCKCSCMPEAATLGFINGSWQCVDNKEYRENELQGKSTEVNLYILYFFNVTRKSYSDCSSDCLSHGQNYCKYCFRS